MRRLFTRLHLAPVWLLIQGAIVGAAVASLVLGVFALVRGEWTAIAALFSAAGFVLALWLAVRARRAEEPRLRTIAINRLAQLEISNSRAFAVQVELQIANLSRAGNAIIAVEAVATLEKGSPAPLTIVRPQVSSVDGTTRYLVPSLNWQAPPETKPTVLPVALAALDVERLHFVFSARLDALLGTDMTNTLLMNAGSGDLARLFIYDITLTIKDIFDRTYSASAKFRPI